MKTRTYQNKQMVITWIITLAVLAVAFSIGGCKKEKTPQPSNPTVNSPGTYTWGTQIALQSGRQYEGYLNPYQGPDTLTSCSVLFYLDGSCTVCQGIYGQGVTRTTGGTYLYDGQRMEFVLDSAGFYMEKQWNVLSVGSGNTTFDLSEVGNAGFKVGMW